MLIAAAFLFGVAALVTHVAVVDIIRQRRRRKRIARAHEPRPFGKTAAPPSNPSNRSC